MGGKKRLRKQYEVPKRQWDKARIEEESGLVAEYGLKNMRELWRMKTLLRRIRREARRLLSQRGAKVEDRTKNLLARVQKFLMRKENLALDDVLSLSDRDMLGRRLQTLVEKKHLATTPKQARQFITHGHISVAGQKVTTPSYLVRFAEEDEINWYGEPITIQNTESNEAAVAAPAKARAPESAKTEAPTPAGETA